MKRVLALASIAAFAACSNQTTPVQAKAVLATASQNIDDSSTVKILKKIEELGADVVGNGYASLDEMDVSKLNVGLEIKKFKEKYADYGRCKFKYVVGRSENLKLMKEQVTYGNEEIQKSLEKLHADGKLKTIIAAHWDGESGDGVACDIHDFDIYTTGNHRLTLNYSLTD
jgi:hypothetical protein